MIRLTVLLLSLVSLGGCAVYPYDPYYDAYQPNRYGQPYYAPGPVYVEPPVFFNFGFGYYGGHSEHHRHH